MESNNSEIAQDILANDILSIVENTEAYDDDIKTMLRIGLKQINNHVDGAELLESVIEEKHHQNQPKFDADFMFSVSSNTNTSNTDDSDSIDSFSPTKIVNADQI